MTTIATDQARRLDLSGEVVLRPREERRLLDGHAWVFSNEIDRSSGAPEPGGVVGVRRSDGRLIGYGLYNPHSLIAVRVFSRTHAALDQDLIRERLEAAASLREILYPGSRSHRLAHGESDGLPGLIIDRYGDAFCIQTLAHGMERLKVAICDVLEARFGASAVVERNESPLRQLEGLPQQSGVLRGSLPGEILVEEADLRFSVDLLHGHKTGFYFDQRENRIALRRYAAGRRCLDLYCNEGAFALHLARAGASTALGADSSEGCLERARTNATINELGERCAFDAGDVPQVLQDLFAAGERFDLINLDPPSFTRSRKNVSGARRAYVDVNRRAMRVLRRGGFLATASCSHHITEETFSECVQEAARSVDRSPVLLEWRSQAPDHPVLPAMPETRYLKLGIYRID